MEKITYIHGLNCSAKIFNFIKTQLPKHKAQFIEYNSGEYIENSFHTALEELTDSEPTWIVGHSLGGIIAHLLAVRATPGLKINGIATIGTPFGGSHVASTLKWFYGGYHVLRDLSPHSKIIREVTTVKPKQPFLSVISVSGALPFISGDNDGVVTVESQRKSLAKKKVDVYANHFEAVQDEATVKAIKEFIFK
jgi:pimeloyl-ACP methyl ester carboxylesterase